MRSSNAPFAGRTALFLSALVILGASFTIGSTLTPAAVPDSINYQGTLKTPGGPPVADGSYNVAFKIYDVASGPDPALWTETKSVTTAGGLFTTFLGSVTSLPPSLFSGPRRFLGISVNTDPEMTPRTAIVAVPYAYRIATVDGAVGGSISGDVAVSSGNINLDLSTATSGNIMKDGVPFIHDFGLSNTFIGSNAGNLTMSGWGNTANGASALHSNTLGIGNTASGGSALFLNTTGNSNTASGADALQSNSTGGSNTASGSGALNRNTTGSDNTASGARALSSNTTGGQNTANGFTALFNNTTGLNNTAAGSSALYSNSTGNNNTASGFEALHENTTGYNNTANGIQSLWSNTAGWGNSASGVGALRTNTVGNANTAGGGWALLENTTGIENSANGTWALEYNTTGSYNTASGTNALSSNTSGSRNTAIGSGANVSAGDLTNATAIGANAIVDASNKIRLGNASVTTICGAVGFTVCSDSTQKENFRPVDGDEILRKIRGLGLSSWNYKGHDPQRFRHYGPMAQAFFAAFGRDGVGTSGDSTTINSQDMDGIMMIALQTLARDNDELRGQIAELREMIRIQTNNAK